MLAVSSDEGASWQRVITPEDNTCFTGVVRAENGDIWVGSSAGGLYCSTDGGSHFVPVAQESVVPFEGIRHLGGRTFFLSLKGALLIHDGEHFTTSTPPTSKALCEITQTASGAYSAVGDGATILRSEDGMDWHSIRSPVRVDLESVAALAHCIIAGGGGGRLIVSQDDGKSFSELPSPTENHLWRIVPFGAGALLGGNDGQLLMLGPPGLRTLVRPRGPLRRRTRGPRPACARWSDEDGWLVGAVEGDVRHGPFRFYRSDGSLSVEHHYEAGVLHGAFRRWHPNGASVGESTCLRACWRRARTSRPMKTCNGLGNTRTAS